MELFKIAWRNLGRNPRRTSVIIAAVAVGVWAMCIVGSYYDALGAQLLETLIFGNIGYVQIHRLDYQKNPSLRLCMTDGAAVINKIKGAPHLTGYSPRIYNFALARSPSTSQGVMIMGMDPDLEPTVTRIKSFIKSGSYFQSNDEPVVLIGQSLANKLKLGAGDKIAFLMQGFSGGQDVVESFRIKGVFASGFDEFDRVVYMPIRQAERIMDMKDRLNEIAIMVDDPKNLEALKAELKARLPSQESDLKVVPEQETLDNKAVHLLGIRSKEPGKLILAPEAITESFKNHPNSELVSYRLELSAIAVFERSGRKRSLELSVIGVEPLKEERLSGIFSRVKVPEGSWLAGAELDKELDANQGWVILGETVAERLGVSAGDTILIEAQGKSLPLQVAGTLQRGPGAREDGLFAIAGSALLLKEFIGQSAASEVVVQLKEGADSKETAKDLLSSLGLDIRDWKELYPEFVTIISSMDYVNYILLFCFYIIIAVGIANTMVMSVFERVREFGILKAIGTRPRQLFFMVILESVMLALTGMALGGLVSGILIGYWSRHGLDVSRFTWDFGGGGGPNVIHPTLTLVNILTIVVTAFVIAILSALYPAARASRLRVVEALSKF